MSRPRPTRLSLLEATLAEAEAGLARAVDAHNSTAEANIISRLHTIRSDYADLLETLPVEAVTPDADEALAAALSLLPFLDAEGLETIRGRDRKPGH